MEAFEHLRHKPAQPLENPRPLIVACPPLRSRVNLARIVRAASCCGIGRMVVCNSGKLDRSITRDSAVILESHRSLLPVLKKWKQEGHRLIGLEQTSGSVSLFDFAFPREAVLVIGHERRGIEDEVLHLLDAVVEIPIYGTPFSHNVATATAMALYEYCRQYPDG